MIDPGFDPVLGEALQTWTIFAEDGRAADPLIDPQQRIRPVLSGADPAIGWLVEDGHIVEHQTFGFDIKYSDGGFKSVCKLDADASMFVTDRRIILLVRDIDPGLGVVGELSDLLTMGASTFLRDVGRSVTGHAGLRERYHLVGQIDYLSLILVRYYQTRLWGTRSLLDLGAFVGEQRTRAIELLATTLPKKVDIAALARDIHARARRAHLEASLQDRTDGQLEAVRNSTFKPSGDGQMATLNGSVITLTQLHELSTTGAGAGEPTQFPAPKE
jgi:hypothetical protein